jgi:hypothetical protein
MADFDSTAQLSPEVRARARKNLGVLLHGLAEASQVKVAARLRVSESTISRMKDAEYEKIAAFVAACGLKLVPEDQETHDSGYVEGLRQLLAIELQRILPKSGFTPLDSD